MHNAKNKTVIHNNTAPFVHLMTELEQGGLHLTENINKTCWLLLLNNQKQHILFGYLVELTN